MIGGSSPRVRGPHGAARECRRQQRLIPARAGTTAARRRNPRRGSAHPRACGDHQQRPAASGGNIGSSPRVRGPRKPARPPRLDVRLIPARAGTTPAGLAQTVAGTAHPRACGDHESSSGSGAGLIGSSPRVRGPRRSAPGAARPPRLIPARAGTTTRSPSSRLSSAAHPRACGDHAESAAGIDTGAGSSPRVRGPRRGAHRGALPRRLIPAAVQCAGDGSSPRVRGPRRRRAPLRALHRLIPARAGTTVPGARRLWPFSAHPRACGDHVGEVGNQLRVVGSSPRVRGPRAQVRRGARRVRLIPARAGTT